MKIKEVKAREILDSRGNPTIEVEIMSEDGQKGVASVPSGASTGSKEAVELRDNDLRYHGKGVLQAVENVNKVIKPKLIEQNFSQAELDQLLIDLDGSENKKNLGANAILGVSIAYLKLCAKTNNQELYEYIADGRKQPMALMNILNGGCHANNDLSFQEFMIIPLQKTTAERVRVGSEIFHCLKKILQVNNYATSVGDEGGFAPKLKNNRHALDLIMQAIKQAGYQPEKEVSLALDAAASEFYQDGFYHCDGEKLTSYQMISLYENLINEYPIKIIEDPLAEDDWEGFINLTEKLGDKVMLVGDDIFVTNPQIFQKGISKNICNAILIKPNQIGTYTEMLETIKIAKKNHYQTIISHRSGETEDTFIADFAVGLDLDYIKTGSLSRTDRVCKYNRLMKIEKAMN